MPKTVRTLSLPHTRAGLKPVAGRVRRPALMQGVSAVALMVAGAAVPAARAGSPYASLNQALALASHAAARSAAVPANSITAGRQAALGVQDMARAARRLNSLNAALAASAAGVPATPNVPNGVGAHAVPQVASGASSTGGTLWLGAALPTVTQCTRTSACPASVPLGNTLVTVTQTRALAQLTWQSFDIGAKTTLDFNQSAGGTLASSWVAINNILNPSANPAQILGSIIATATRVSGGKTVSYTPGKVYLIDRDGIAFGRGSTVNVGALIASTADIASSQFTTTLAGVTSFALYGAQTIGTSQGFDLNNPREKADYAPSFTNCSASRVCAASGDITVAAGATLQTAQPSGVNQGGYVMLFGANVTNAGVIDTPQGQTVLAAGNTFYLRQGFQSASSGNTFSTVIGSEVASSFPVPPKGQRYAEGSVRNDGVIVSSIGDISLVGHALAQNGALLSTTTVDTRGTIHFLTPTDGADNTASIAFGPSSVTEILPEDAGLTALDSQRTALVNTVLNGRTGTSGTLALNNSNTLPDRRDESRVEISTAGSTVFQGGALLYAPGGQIQVGAGSQVLLESGATLDVSGTTNAILPASLNDLLVNVQPYQLRDSAANRDGALKSQNVYVDARTLVAVTSGIYAADTPIYTQGGLLEVSGYLGLVAHHIAEWTAIGGQVDLVAQQPVITGKGSTIRPGAVIAAPGSVINLQGGSVTYSAGIVDQTYVQASNGEIYNINVAPGNLVYTGVYNGETFSHARWHVSNTYANPLLTPGRLYEPAYTVGRDAGTLTVNAGTVVLAGDVPAGVTIGPYQNGARPAGVGDPYLLAQTVVPLAGALQIGDYQGGALQTPAANLNVTIQAGAAPAISATGTLPAGTAGTAILNAATLNADGFATIDISTAGSLAVTAPLAAADGGTVALTGAHVTVDAGITAHGGAITLSDQQVSGSGTLAAATVVGTRTSLVLGPQALLDVSGDWTNALRDPLHLAGFGHANGGNVKLAFTQGVDLRKGAVIDVSSGGGITTAGKLQTASGGSVSIAADFYVGAKAVVSRAAVTLDESIVAYGSKGGGTLSLFAPAFQFGGTPATASTIALAPSLLRSGFSKYVIDGFNGLTVAAGTTLSAQEPIYELSNGTTVPTGDNPAHAYTVVLPPLYLPSRNPDILAERPGASVTLLAATDPQNASTDSGGSLSIGTGASLLVDPGQSISLAAYGQVTVLGTLVAHGGTISVANTAFDGFQATGNPSPAHYRAGVSVWIGDAARLDASGVAVTATDSNGRTFGLAQAGGTISLGAYLQGAGGQSTWAPVIVRPGALLDVSGAAARVSVVAGTEIGAVSVPTSPVTLAGQGGVIAVRSLLGTALDGTLRAAGGAADAAGGTLVVELDPINYAILDLPGYLRQNREILVTGSAVQGDPGTLQPGQVPPHATLGLARISAAQIADGGFGTVDLKAQLDPILFAGSVTLTAPQSIVLASGVVGDTSATANVRIAAPHVSFQGDNGFLTGGTAGDFAVPVAATHATLAVAANLIDVADIVYLGGAGYAQSIPASAANGTATATFAAKGYGFAQADFASSGDIRVLGASANAVSGLTPELLSIGNLTLRAAQVYPASGASATLEAGFNPASLKSVQVPRSTGTLTIQRAGAVPQAPYSVGGSLTFLAETIVQDGIVRAPEGTLTLSDGAPTVLTPRYASSVTFGLASITSVSLDGVTVPYGGTVDGVNYTLPNGAAAAILQPQITITAESVQSQPGARIDLRGGGTLTGAGWVFGRGGSVDVLTGPLLNLTGGTLGADAAAQVAAITPANLGDQVFAILPGYDSSYAPPAEAGATTYATPGTFGERITIDAAVPGLPAGTYTLLPANDALLPGGWRVELTTGTTPLGSVTSAGNYTSLVPVTVGVANTGIMSPVPQAALLTSGTNVRNLAQYNEESYSTFEAKSAALFGLPRPLLPEDAKALLLLYPNTIGKAPALALAAGTLEGAPAAGGYGDTVQITTPNPIAIVGPGDTAPGRDLALSAAGLDTLDPARLVIGGTLSTSGNVIVVTGIAADVTVEPHAQLSAGEVLLTTDAAGVIAIAAGGTISALGTGTAAQNFAAGYFLGLGSIGGTLTFPVLDVANSQIVFETGAVPSNAAAITIGNGSAVLASGSLNIVAPVQTTVTIGAANIGARYLNITVAAANIIGDFPQYVVDPTGADVGGTPIPGALTQAYLPLGISLTQQTLAAILNGNAALGTPAAQQFILTATSEVNFVGDVSLNTGATSIVLNTPAIYGDLPLGAKYSFASNAPASRACATACASVTAANFTWSGIAAQGTLANGTPGPFVLSSAPGAAPAGAGGVTVLAADTLSITAGTILLGYGPQAVPPTAAPTELDRLVGGFSDVVLTGTTEITASGQDGLSVYQTQTTYGSAGAGGNLTLSSPLVTTASGAVLRLVAGGALTLDPPSGAALAATGPLTTLGGQIDLTGRTIAIDTAVGLPSGKLDAVAQEAITVGAGANIDLSGRSIAIRDQVAQSPGGTLILETTAGSILIAGATDGLAAAALNVGAPGAAAGTITLSALDGSASGTAVSGAPGTGTVELDGTLLGVAGAGQPGGNIAVVAGTLATAQAAGSTLSAFDAINLMLDQGGFLASRRFEFSVLQNTVGGSAPTTTSVLVIDNQGGQPVLEASTIAVTNDAGSIEVSGTVYASGNGPGTISLSAAGNLTLDPTALLDAHARTTGTDGYGPVDALNRAAVTLTTTGTLATGGALATGGTLTIGGGTIDVGYPGNEAGASAASPNPQGQVVLNAPRTADGIAFAASGSLTVLGAQSIALYGWKTYFDTNAAGDICQHAGCGVGTLQTGTGPAIFANAVTLDQIQADNQAFMNAAEANTALATQLSAAGLPAYGGQFHLRPGVAIQSTDLSKGNLTVVGDLDLSALRYSDKGYGATTTSGDIGSGEPGAIVFRAKTDLWINGSISDGFAPPPGGPGATYLKQADNGWVYLSGGSNPGAVNPLNADVFLPESAVSVAVINGRQIFGHTIDLLPGTIFDNTRAVSLNYPITIVSDPNSSSGTNGFNANVVIPFKVQLGADIVVPAGGVQLTAAIVTPAGRVFRAGTVLKAGTDIPAGSSLSRGSLFSFAITIQDKTTVPAGTPLSDFTNPLTLSIASKLPVNAFIPSNTQPNFGAEVTVGGITALKPVRVRYRPTQDICLPSPCAGHSTKYMVQGLIYPLAAMLPAGSQSWSLDFVAGANLDSASADALTPPSVLAALQAGTKGAVAPNTPYQAPGSIILDDQHDLTPSTSYGTVAAAFSVIRTGTGDLSFHAAGNFDQSSLYGIYTAGTQSANVDAKTYSLAREGYNFGTSVVPGASSPANIIATQDYQAYYPTGGGNVVVDAQGSVTGDVVDGYTANGAYNQYLASDAIGNWLWRQGSTQLNQPTAWWINFGTFVTPYVYGETGTATPGPGVTQLVGFQGIGALGGGNVTVNAGGDAGQITNRTGANLASGTPRGEGLVIAIASTGREAASGSSSFTVTGGGKLTLNIGGTLNPLNVNALLSPPQQDLTGDLIDLRGNVAVTAGQIGLVSATYNATAGGDPRPVNPYAPQLSVEDNTGITVVPGDGTVGISALRDLVITGVGDAGRVTEQNLTYLPQGPNRSYSSAGGATAFTLWTSATAVSLFSSGGNVVPVDGQQGFDTSQSAPEILNADSFDGRMTYPSQLTVIAATGDITTKIPLETAPSVNEQVVFLAGQSIQSTGFAPVDLSGANPAGLATPISPNFDSNLNPNAPFTANPLTNANPFSTAATPLLSIFAQEADTPTIAYLSPAAAAAPALFVAGGDILNFITGETITFASGSIEPLAQWYLAAKSVRIEAGGDIVNSGSRPASPPGATALQQNQAAPPNVNGPAPAYSYTSSGDLFYNPDAQSVSVVSAGQDILSGYFYVGGPGLLVVQAGRNIDQIGSSGLQYGSIKSLGALETGAPVSLSGGAGVSVLAGIGNGPSYTAFADLYLQPANLANPTLPSGDPANAGKVQGDYVGLLATFLQQNYGYEPPLPATPPAGFTQRDYGNTYQDHFNFFVENYTLFPTASRDVFTYFVDPANVSISEQSAFVQSIFFDELLASSTQYADPASRFYQSYARGKQAIDTLFPSRAGGTAVSGVPHGYAGAITMATGNLTVTPPGGGTVTFTIDAGVATEHGGVIQAFDPGGQITLGTSGGVPPGSSTGFVTNGNGDINVFALGSVLLGQSRIFTNAGGNIQIWSADGNINAGIGARTTVTYDPPLISYDDTGGIVETPAVPTSGAGIATNNPLPGIAAGNIDLTAPLGVIDAGEAGIRATGNVTLAALTVLNAANIQSGGKTTGISVAPSISVGAANAASAAGAAATAAAQTAGNTGKQQEQLPSDIEVEVFISGGGGA